MAKLITNEDGYQFWQAEPGDEPNPLYPGSANSNEPSYALPTDAKFDIQVNVPTRQEPVAEAPTPNAASFDTPTHNLIPIDYDPFERAAERTRAKYEDRNQFAPIEEGGVADKLLGVTGERFQTWPERMVRSGTTLAKDLMDGKVKGNLGLRREDFTDVPAQTGVFGEQLMGSQPQDELVERVQDMSGLMGGGSIAAVKPGVATVGSGPIRQGLKEITIRDKDANIGHESLNELTKPNHFYRAMTKTEYDATIGAGKGIVSRQDHSVPNEGTSFAYDVPTAESYANYGRTDPRKTGEPTFLVEVSGNDGLVATRDGYLKAAKEIPSDRITRIIKMEPKDGALVGTVLRSDSGTPGAGIAAAKAIDWNLINNAEKSLAGTKIERAIDTWVGGPADAKTSGHEGGFWHPGPLKEALKNPETKAELDAVMQPIRDDLKAKYGDTITLYRAHGELPPNAKARELLSFTSDPNFAERHGNVPKERKAFSDSDIAAKEKEYLENGEVEIGSYKLVKNEYGYADIYNDSSGGFVTDTDSITQFMKDINADVAEHNSMRQDRLKNVVKQEIPIDNIVFATDRFGQKEFIVRNNGTLFSDSGTPGAGIAAVANSPRFYSAVEQAVTTNPQAKMSGQQWLGTLKNAKGVKPEEMDWIGLNDFLANKKNVTKQEIQDYIQNNQVELKEVSKGGDYSSISPEQRQFLHETEDQLNQGYLISSADRAEYDRLNGILDDDFNGKNDRVPKFSQYVLPGGENYKELLITTPAKDYSHIKPEMIADNHWQITDPNGKQHDFKTRLAANRWVKEELEQTYTSSHWDEKNVLAHVRTNERMVDGKPSLHVEEIQSDWHQAGREKGYKGDLTPELKEQGKVLSKKLDKHPDQKLIDQILNHENEAGAMQMAVDNGVFTKAEADTFRQFVKADAAQSLGVPNAPFKKTWHELAIKRMIREASEKGFERLSWTPGEAQAARYDLSKQIDRIKFSKNSDGTYNIVPFKNDQPVEAIRRENVKQNELGDLIGKEVAEKIVHKADGANPYEPLTELPEGYRIIHDANGKARNQEWGVLPPNQNHAQSYTGRYHATEEDAVKSALDRMNSERRHKHDDVNNTLDNLDLKVGGEGMKGFYDKMLPNYIEKLGKEYGVKVKKGETVTGSDYNIEQSASSGKWLLKSPYLDEKSLSFATKAEAEAALATKADITKAPVFYIDIPQQMRDTATQRGFPLFVGNHILIPTQDPFNSENK